MRGLSDAQRAKLLFFVTGSPRVPVGGFERSRYSAGPERFVVERAGVAGRLVGGGEGAVMWGMSAKEERDAKMSP